MTKGRLLAINTPSSIKKQFGVGYKLMIKPRLELTTQSEFKNLKLSKIDPIVLSSENLANNVEIN
jgi:hypothetical protein